MKMHERLRLAREERGFSSASDAAEALGIPYGTYSGHENGSRGITRKNAARYAAFFGVSIPWLEHGVGEGPDATEAARTSETSPAVHAYVHGLAEHVNLNGDASEKSDRAAATKPGANTIYLDEAIAVAEGVMLANGLDPQYLGDLYEILRECFQEPVVSSTPQSALESRRNLARSTTSRFLRQHIAQSGAKRSK